MPANICKLTSLVELNMDFCDIVTLPPDIGHLQALEALQMDGNPLEYPSSALYSKDPLLLVNFANHITAYPHTSPFTC
jgi:Leucine-rich repeat (LRR) protein